MHLWWDSQFSSKIMFLPFALFKFPFNILDAAHAVNALQHTPNIHFSLFVRQRNAVNSYKGRLFLELFHELLSRHILSYSCLKPH
ncbi:hypothetical protein CW304_13920 [Bacillus sp. UFRGS-B20]|nr:hypothetical protein CW304_13920 [Bacillus sp. UFRGS-B20]